MHGRHKPEHPELRPSVTSRRGLYVGLLLLAGALGLPLADVAWRAPSSDDADLVVACTASQWKWRYDYQTYHHTSIPALSYVSAMQLPKGMESRKLSEMLFNADSPTATADELLDVDEPLVLPTGKRVRFVITSEDSIHAWWLPALQVKKEAIPGFTQSIEVALPEQPGTYRGLCSQLCGQEHAFMPIVVKLVSPEAFELWLADKSAQLQTRKRREIPDRLPVAALLTAGKAIYHERCSLCHQAEGEGLGERVPALASSALIAGPADALADFLKQGKNIMPGMRDILARDDLAALATYLRLRWSQLPEHEAIVQPTEATEAF